MITATELRNDIYNKLGSIIATGVPIDVEYKGRIIHITSANAPSKLSLFPPRKGIVGDPEDLIHNDWIKEWRNDLS